MAGDPAFTDLLVGMGLPKFLHAPHPDSAVKQRLLRADTQRLEPLVQEILQSEDPKDAADRLLGSYMQIAH